MTTTRSGWNFTVPTQTPVRSSRRLNAEAMRPGDDLQFDGFRHLEPTV